MKGHQRIIPKDSAYARWELPAMGQGGANSKSQSQHPAVTAFQVEELQQQAYDEGFQEGRAAGFDKGLEEGRTTATKESRAKLALFERLIHALTRPLEALDQEVEESLVTLAMAVARQFVRRELHSEPGEIVAVAREAISALPVAAKNARLYLHPEDAAIVREALSLDAGASWNIVEDPVLTRGGCRVESDYSRIDASVESRLASVIADVMGGERERDRTPEP